jgi:hypothetical protein
MSKYVFSGLLAVVTEAICLLFMASDSAFMIFCWFLHLPATIVATLFGLLGLFLGCGSLVESWPTPLFGFLWFWLLYLALFGYGRKPAQPGVSPNGGPAELASSSGGSDGPPSVSQVSGVKSRDGIVVCPSLLSKNKEQSKR